MKTKFFLMMVLAALLIGGNACTEEDNGLSSGDTPQGNGGVAVPDPEGTILVSVRNENNGKTIVDLFEVGGFYIDEGDNFVPYYSGYYSGNIEFCSVGAVNGLGNVREAPAEGWASRVAVQEGYGYFARYKKDNSYYVYARLYVEKYILSAANTVLGAYVKYQSPYEPENIENLLVDIPDAQFRAYLSEEFDTNSDDILTPEEASLVTVIWCLSRQISSLQGIELFPNLTTLNCSFNEITELPQLPPKLTTLNCAGNNIAELPNLPTTLTTLDCAGNDLSSFDFSRLSNLKNLEELDCSYNKMKELINLPTTLTTLRCAGNDLSSFDFSKLTNLTNLEKLDCSSNNLAVFDVPKLNNLKILDLSDNQLTQLSVSLPILEELNCKNNQLTDLDVSSCSRLDDLDCRNNLLTQLSLQNNRALSFLHCESNRLTELDLSQCGLIFYSDIGILDKNQQQIYAYCTGNPDLAVIYLSASIPQYSASMITKDDFTQIAYK